MKTHSGGLEQQGGQRSSDRHSKLLRRGLPATIKDRLYLLLFSLLVPILLVQTAYFYHRIQIWRANIHYTNLELAQRVAEAFDVFISDVLNTEFAVGLHLTLPYSPSVEQMNHILDMNRQTYSTVRDFAWLDPQGRVIASSLRDETGFDVISDHAGFREIAAGREWFVSDLCRARITDLPSLLHGEGDDERCAPSRCAFRSDVSSMTLDYFTANGEPYSRSLIHTASAVETFERHLKHSVHQPISFFKEECV